MFKNFQDSAKNLKKTRVLCAAAVFAALYVVLYAAKLPITAGLRISFTYISLALSGWLLGPVPAMLVGFVGDILGSNLFPQGAYFPGFTLTSVLSGLIYGLILYRRNPKKMLFPVAISKLTTNLFMNIGLNSFWLYFIMGNGWLAGFADRVVKNIIALPIEVIVLLLIIKILHSYNVEKMYK